MNLDALLTLSLTGHCLSEDQALALAGCGDTLRLAETAEQLAIRGFGPRVSYSRKVFIPLTQLCRDVCHYCTFAQPPRKGERAYLDPGEVLAIAHAGAAAGCDEALFTLGDKPELRYAVAREELRRMGFATTLEYLGAMARAVVEKTGLLPHLNPGVMCADDITALRPTAVSMGTMLESASARLCGKGMPHVRSPDKVPEVRLATLRVAGECAVPFTTGILIGIGETRRERIEALLAIRDLHGRYGHIQEIIIQNFRAKAGTRMARHAEPDLEDLRWTVAIARLIFGPQMSIQAPPNLSPGELVPLLRAGLNDWGGVSPVTPDHVNPEAPWPQLTTLAAQTEAAGRALVPRLAIAPMHARELDRWVDARLHTVVLRRMDSLGYARPDGWFAGAACESPHELDGARRTRHASAALRQLIERARRGIELSEAEIAGLFDSVGEDLRAVLEAADTLRADMAGEEVTFVVNRNINYTNVCRYRCGFCAFAKGRSADSLRGAAYNLDLEEIARRTREARQRGATEVCLQGGIHPAYDGHTYLRIVAAVRAAVSDMHVHAFSPLEITHGAATLGLSLQDYLTELARAGLRTLPGTAAEILHDDVRRVICPDKIDTAQWLAVMRAAHRVGLQSTATIMFGHVDAPLHWARHLLEIRRLQLETGGFTEFVPLPFVHMEAPLWRKGRARSGPTFSEALLMHAVARLVLHPVITNIQTSWVKMGLGGAALCLQAGSNDLGGTLMNESITRAAGGINGQEQDAATLARVAAAAGRTLRQRTTLYKLQ